MNDEKIDLVKSFLLFLAILVIICGLWSLGSLTERRSSFIKCYDYTSTKYMSVEDSVKLCQSIIN